MNDVSVSNVEIKRTVYPITYAYGWDLLKKNLGEREEWAAQWRFINGYKDKVLLTIHVKTSRLKQVYFKN